LGEHVPVADVSSFNVREMGPLAHSPFGVTSAGVVVFVQPGGFFDSEIIDIVSESVLANVLAATLHKS
jgi:hypothetical protein